MKKKDLLNSDTSKLVTYSNPELLLLTGFMRHELQPNFVIAIEEELAKRTITDTDIEEHKKIENYEIRRANEMEQRMERQVHNGGLGILFLVVSFCLLITIYLGLFGLITYAIGIYYISNSNYSITKKIICIASPVMLILIILASLNFIY